MPRYTYIPTNQNILKLIRKFNSILQALFRNCFFLLHVFTSHTHGKRCSQQGFCPCYFQSQVVYAYHVLSLLLLGFVWSKYHFRPFFGPDIKIEMGVVIYMYLKIPQIMLFPNIYGFMGLTPWFECLC